MVKVLQASCPRCGLGVVTFPEDPQDSLTVAEIREKYPRGRCCKTIYYASALQYLMGDY